MKTPPFSIPAIMKASWRKVKGCKGKFCALFFSLTLVSQVARLLPQGVNRLSFSANSLLPASSLLSALVNQLALQPSLGYLGLQRATDQELRYDMLRQVFNTPMMLKIAGLLAIKLALYLPALLIAAGSFLAMWNFGFNGSSYHLTAAEGNLGIMAGVALGYYLMMRLSLATAVVLMENKDPWSAVKTSFHMTAPVQGRLITLQVTNLALAVFVTVLTLGIGLIWLIPYLYITQGMIYSQLKT